MLMLLGVGFVFAFALVDLILLFMIGLTRGIFPMLAIIFLPSFLGGRLARLQGRQCLQRIQHSLASGRPPSVEMAEGGTLLVCGLLLLYPGPISKLLGILLLVPPIRKGIARVLVKRWSRRMTGMRPDEEADPWDAGAEGTRAPFSNMPPTYDAQGLKMVEGEDLGSHPLPDGGDPGNPELREGESR